MAQLNFSIALNLLTDQFKNGVSRVKSGFASLRMQVFTFVAALQVADLSIAGFISKLIDTARATNRAVTALKNVSPNLQTFAKNQQWLIDLSQKYGTDVNTLTGEFAKFTAAGTLMNMPLKDQRKIFESVDRACTGFSLTAEDTNSVFLALTQMMGKGKIQAQELRLQMGEKLPVAINAMAMAAGGSLGNLDKLMKEGKLLSADVLPKFADALNKLIPNVNTDNLETSIKRMNNAFTMAVKNTSVQSTYKSLVDWITNLIKSAANNIKTIVSQLAAFLEASVFLRIFRYLSTEYQKSFRILRLEAAKSAKSAGVAFDEMAFKAKSMGATIKLTWKRISESIISGLKTLGITAVIEAFFSLIARIREIYAEVKRINGIVSEGQKSVSNAGFTQQIATLKNLQKIANDVNESMNRRKSALREINSQLGTNYSIDVKTKTISAAINKDIEKRIGLLMRAAKASAAAQDEIDTRNNILSLQDKLRAQRDTSSSFGRFIDKAEKLYALVPGAIQLLSLLRAFDSTLGAGKNADLTIKEIAENRKRLANDLKMEKSYYTPSNDNGGGGGNTLPSPKGDKSKKTKDKQSELEKAQDKYAQSLAELNARYELEKMTESQYTEAKAQLLRQTLIDAQGTRDLGLINSQWLQERKKELSQSQYDTSNLEFIKAREDYSNKVGEQINQLSKGVISEKEYSDNMVQLAIETAKAILAIKGIGDKGNDFVKYLQNVAAKNLIIPSLKEKKADTTFDYRKQKGESNEEELQRVQEYLQLLKDKANSLGGAISEELDKAIAEATTKEASLKLNVVKQDIKNMQKELSRTEWDTIKDGVSNVESLVSTFETLTSAIKDNASAWEVIMDLWNSFSSVIDTINSVADAIDNITQLTTKLGMAKEKEATIDNITTGQKISNLGMTSAANAVAGAGELALDKKQIAGNVGVAASETMKNNAKIPIVGIALAAAGVMAILALMNRLPHFASGGIIGGSSFSGDKLLAGVNSGEMILNKSQQSNLFKAISSGKLGGGTNVNIGFDKVRGSDIYLSLKNYMKSTGKSL